MARLNILLDDKIKKEFGLVAQTKYGLEKGFRHKAGTEAIKDWIKINRQLLGMDLRKNGQKK